MSFIVWDIETAPLADDVLRAMMPALPDADILAPLGEFDLSSVKVGNLKPENAAAKIEAARMEHDKLKAEYPSRLQAAKDQQFAEFKSKAALSATTGRVLVIGYYSPHNEQVKIDWGGPDASETKTLATFWTFYDSCRKTSTALVGLNIHDFDLPFLVRRSWLNDVAVPATVLRQDRYWDDVFVDLRKRWLCGQQASGQKSNFDFLGSAFGTGGKTDGINGGDFARLWIEDRAKAIEYLTNDLKQPAAWARQMGVL